MTYLTFPSQRLGWIGPVLGIALLASCGSPPELSSVQSEMDASTTESLESLSDSALDGESAQGSAEVAMAPAALPTDGSTDVAQDVPASLPQLAKQASLTLQVDSIADAVDAVAAIARTQQGDILNLDDSSSDIGLGQQAIARLRVPQSRLESTLNEIAALGRVQQRQITAEDVSTQLVDLDARLRNLRKTEAMLLGIMERSGSVGDVLQVAQEVSQVRASIEQIDAQRQQLRNRVSYSTVTVVLESAIANSTAPLAIRDELGNTWQRATLSFRNASVGLMKLALWLLVYSPYLAILLLCGVGLYQLRRRTIRRDAS
ncbi:MAG: DUF4349 domain-containing protein [Elainellaceae cyanobacterium]